MKKSRGLGIKNFRDTIWKGRGYKQFIILGLVLIILLFVPLIVYFTQQQVNTQGHADGINCTSTGVGIKPDGTHFFSWIHVDPSTNTLRDQNNCKVILRGIVQEAAFGDGGASITKPEIDLLTKNIHLNYWRLNLNPVWWLDNVEVPNAVNATTGSKGMAYQDWIMQLIGWMKSDGLYVELDKGSQFTEPPCGSDGHGVNNTFCPSQNSGSNEAAGTPKAGDPDPSDMNAWQETSDGNYMIPSNQMWRDISARFRNDPAIWYDSWNEVHNLVKTNSTQWQQNQDKLIQIIQNQNPNALVIVYYDQNDIKANLHYAEPNVVIDFHVYPSEWGASTAGWPTQIDQAVQYAFKDGHGVIFNEWGGATGATTEPYNTNVNSYATAHNIGMSDYEAPNLYDKPTMQLTSEGIALSKDNAILPWNPYTKPLPTVSPSISSAPSISSTPSGCYYADDNRRCPLIACRRNGINCGCPYKTLVCPPSLTPTAPAGCYYQVCAYACPLTNPNCCAPKLICPK